MDFFLKGLEALREKNLYRERELVGEDLINLCSNDYLGLSKDGRVVETLIRCLKETKRVGSGASALVSGYTREHKELEEYLAHFKEAPRCVLFGSGYLANVGVIPSLVGEGDVIFSDQLNHASIIDGCRLSKAKVFIFKHKDYKELEELLIKLRKNYRRCLIVSDSVFSMEGDLADLKTLRKLSQEYDCILYIDDAHGTGTIGEGRGILREFKLNFFENLILMGTLSKAVGAYGAFVCAKNEVIDYLINLSRTQIFSTSLPPCLCKASPTSLKIIEENPELSLKLRQLSEKIYLRLKEFFKEVHYYKTPIIPIIVGEEGRTLKVYEFLKENGFFLRAIRYPAVPKGRARLRLTVSLAYDEEILERFFEVLLKVPFEFKI